QILDAGEVLATGHGHQQDQRGAYCQLGAHGQDVHGGAPLWGCRLQGLVADGEIHRAARLFVGLGGFVVAVEQIRQLDLQAPGLVEAVLAAQVHQGVARHARILGVARLVEALARRVQRRAHADGTELAIQVQVELALGAALQQMAVVGLAAVLRVHEGHVGGHVPAGQHGGDAGLDAADARHVDVFRTHGAAARPDDQVLDLVLVGTDAPLAPAVAATDTDLIAFRFLRLDVRVAGGGTACRVVQVVEGRRTVGGAVGGGQRQRVAQVEAVTQAAGVVRTEELILVATQPGLHAVAAEGGLVLDEVALVVAAVLGVVAIAVDAIRLVVHAEAQHLRLAEIEIVLPGGAVAAGVEARIETTVLEVIAQVLAVPGLQGDIPEGQRREARTAADRLQGTVAVGIAARGSAARTGVEITVVFALQPAAVEFQAIVEAIAGAQLCREFAVAVGI